MFRLKNVTENDINKVKAIHKEKPFHKINDFIIMSMGLNYDTRYKIVKELELKVTKTDEGIYQFFHNNIKIAETFTVGEIDRKKLVVMEEIEDVFTGYGWKRTFVSRRYTGEFHMAIIDNDCKKIFYQNYRHGFVMSADSIEGLRKKYKERFLPF